MKYHRIKSIIKPKIKSLNTIIIDPQKLLANLEYLRSLQPGHAFFPVLKSNAYGHGLELVSKLLRKVDLPYICVDSFPEYQIVRDRSKHKVLVMGETFPDNYRYYDPKYASFAVYNLQTIRYLAIHPRHCNIHLFLNTGMNREGLQRSQIDEALGYLKAAKHITVEGVMSHLANADEIDTGFNFQQVNSFKIMLQNIKQHGHNPKWIHIGNSSGLVKIKDPIFNAHRPGIAFYGYNPLHHDDKYYHKLIPLQAALSVYSTIISTQELQKGDILSYGSKYEAQKNEHIATLPFGYYEGLPRAVSGKHQVKRNDNFLPQLGTICMNLCSIGIEGYPIKIGDQIEIIGQDHQSPNSVYHLSKAANTVPYEILVNLNQSIKRVLKSNP